MADSYTVWTNVTGPAPTEVSIADKIRRLVAGQVVVLWIAVLLLSLWLYSSRARAALALRQGISEFVIGAETPAMTEARRQRRERQAEDTVFLTTSALVLLLGGALAVTWVWLGRNNPEPHNKPG